MTSLWHDLRYAIRILRMAPGFTLIAVSVLAIGIGANSAIFSLVDAVLLRPLPYHHPEELVKLWEHPPGYARNSVAPLNYLDWSEQNHVFSSMAAVSGGSRTLTRDGSSPEKIPGQAVTLHFFDLLAVKPVAGRTFIDSDMKAPGTVVVLSERVWRDRFGSDPNLPGKTITLDGVPFTILGIVPADFQAFYKADMWTPFVPKRSAEQRRMHYLQVLGRLKPGATVEQARADMSVIAANISRISPETNKEWGVTIEPLRQATVGVELRTTSLVLAGVVGFVLLMACANVANLLLARAAGRRREIAVRAALGGSRARIIRQLLTESALLSVMGGAVGIGLAWLVVDAAPLLLPPGTLPVAILPALDLRVIGFAVALTLATGLLFGLAPAWQASRISLADALRSGGRSIAGSGQLFRTVLAAGEIAVAVMLMAGAGLLLRTLGSLNNVDPGYRANNLLTMYIGLPFNRYKTPDRTRTFFDAVQRELSAIPGVKSAAMTTNLPLDGWDIGQGFNVVGQTDEGESKHPSAHYQMASANYFDTMGIRLVAGRPFTPQDTAESTPVCVVNEELVRRFLKGRNPIGVRMTVQAMDNAGPKPVVREIVGVIHQVKVEGPAEKENALEIYVPLAQNSWFGSAIAVRTSSDPLSYTSAIRQAIAKVDKDQPVTRVRTIEEVAAEAVAQPRFRAELVSAFAALALLLAAVGVAGVLAFGVTQRTREFGIRMALGAKASQVLRMVLGSAFKMIAAGVVVGLIGAAALTRWLTALLFGVTPLDGVTFVATPAVLAMVALMACALPAIRAARVDPAIALREE